MAFTRVLIPSEADQLLGAIDLRDPFGPRDHAMLQLAMHTGLRVGELVGLDVGLVSLDGAARSVLFVPASIAKGGQGHERLVPLNSVAQAAVEAMLRFNRARGFSVAPQAPLFVTTNVEHYISGYAGFSTCESSVSPTKR